MQGLMEEPNGWEAPSLADAPLACSMCGESEGCAGGPCLRCEDRLQAPLWTAEEVGELLRAAAEGRGFGTLGDQLAELLNNVQAPKGEPVALNAYRVAGVLREWRVIKAMGLSL